MIRKGKFEMFTIDTNIDDCKKCEELKEFADLFQGRRDGQPKDEEGKTFAELQEMFPAWNPDSMLMGLERLAEIGKTQGQHVYSVYSEEEIAADPTKEVVKIIHYPGKKDAPSVIACAGGAYMSVCSLAEAFPVAAEFNRMGYHVFVLNYRTSDGKSGAIPMPTEDMAAAVTYIQNHMSELGMENDRYAVTGFSAGGNLVCTWGLKNVGYEKYHVKRPDAVFANYALTSLIEVEKTDGRMILDIMFGKNYSSADVKNYDIISNIDADYPPCYITACEDDDTVPCMHSTILYDRLQEVKVPSELNLGKTGGHGYGNGGGTDVAGWTGRAAAFWEKLAK